MSKQPISNKIVIPERKIWSPEEDSILKEIMSIDKQQKWSDIAKIMQTKYNIVGRTGKQCRQRWHNQLDPNIKNQTWTQQEQDKLFEYHNQYGNKWAKIAHILPGRTDNSIKNHFYCTLRKALRRINKFINLPKNKGKYKQIKNMILSKVIAVAEQKFQRKLQVPQQLIDKCCDIKNRLIIFSKQIDTQEEKNQDQLANLVDSIMEFNKLYKRKKNIKKAKTETNKSSQQDDSNQQNQQEQNDKVQIQSYPLQTKRSIKKEEIKIDTEQPKSVLNQNVFSKKPSLRGYLLTPSMEMQLQDRLRPSVSAYPNFNFQPSSPPRMDGTSLQVDTVLNKLITTSQQGFAPISNDNLVWGQLRKIQSFDYQNFRKFH